MSTQPPERPSASRKSYVVIGLALLAIIVVLAWPGKPPSPAPSGQAADTQGTFSGVVESSATNAPAPTNAPQAEVKKEFLPLTGRWLRADGGYVLEIRSLQPGGKLDAAYFNPRPIRVASAEAMLQADKVRVLVELRDEGYPGCTYTLTLDRATGQLVGTYFQAAMQETFEVAFERMK